MRVHLLSQILLQPGPEVIGEIGVGHGEGLDGVAGLGEDLHDAAAPEDEQERSIGLAVEELADVVLEQLPVGGGYGPVDGGSRAGSQDGVHVDGAGKDGAADPQSESD